MKFKLKPGDSVFHSFDGIAEDKYIPSKNRISPTRFQDDQLLTVSFKSGTLQGSNQGLSLVSDYLKTGISMDRYEPSSKEKRIRRRNSEFQLKAPTIPQSQSVLSEYKEYLRLLSKTMPKPNIKKLLPSILRRGKGNNPIVVVTKHK